MGLLILHSWFELLERVGSS